MIVIATKDFKRELKRLGKKYKSLRSDIAALGLELLENPTMGIAIGQGCYKIRLAITAKNKGKSGGGRVITHVRVVEDTVFLLSIYDKSEQEDIADDDLNQRLSALNEQPPA
jgi:mRNA-degrading endonuclease RelE of RelBE toxin-antitoxin system